ncbi:uncharacterized protein B0H18DRAFT_953777 [Fomitopsis serialis]|uniref:uncharacterized protein n=1 Tax=Fomitopsis serialis TaxID=139415 RepID=UPI002008DCC3|nr:uncharacterized protein B0H18DRAFT_953777 [Neoantrodia serialis]KAH9928863.1 hypothetical protein B0H18DRAFT_953777 [Neoantrodia serialis]
MSLFLPLTYLQLWITHSDMLPECCRSLLRCIPVSHSRREPPPRTDSHSMNTFQERRPASKVLRPAFHPTFPEECVHHAAPESESEVMHGNVYMDRLPASGLSVRSPSEDDPQLADKRHVHVNATQAP